MGRVCETCNMTRWEGRQVEGWVESMRKEITDLRDELDLVSDQRDMIAATADRYEAALQYIAGHADDECQDIGCVITAAASALHWQDSLQEER